MKKTIYDIYGKVLIEVEIDYKYAQQSHEIQLGQAAQVAVKNGNSLTKASMAGASMEGARMEGARMEGANLMHASLEGASMAGANLMLASMEGASLEGANLMHASLEGASMAGARMEGANLPYGETWEEYLDKVVPSLLTAGGKTLEEVLASGAWDCHTWNNCPMHVAFGISGWEEAPLLLRPRVREFVQYFDAKLIPKPEARKDEK